MPILQNVMVEDADLPALLPQIPSGQGQATASSPTFSPLDIPSIALWLRADLGITIGTGVSAWVDQSGTGDPNKTATQATGSAQPTYNAANGLYNGQATMLFNGANSQVLTSGTWAAPLAQPSTWFYVFNLTNTNTQYVTDGISSGHRAGLLYSAGSMSIVSQADLSVATSLAAKTAIVGVFNGTVNSAIYQNSSSAPVVTGSSGAVSTLTGLTIGSAYNNSDFLNANVAEIIAYASLLTQPQMSQVLVYLSNRYGGSWS